MGRSLLPGALAALLLAASASAQSLDLAAPRPGQEVALGDGLEIRGSLFGGGDRVYYWLFNLWGSSPGGRCRTGDVTVAGGSFATNRGVEGLDLRGDYTLVVQGLGADGKYSDGSPTGDGKLFGTAERNLNCNDSQWVTGSAINNKQSRDLVSVLQANSVTSGSDDARVFKVVPFRVADPFLKADDCPAVQRGSDVRASGTTNRADGTVIRATVSGQVPVSPQTAAVRNGSFSVTFPGSEFSLSGTYTVAFDDGKGNSAATLCPVTFVAGSGSTPAPPATPATATPPPPPSPTPTPAPVAVVSTPPPASPPSPSAAPEPTPPPPSPSSTPRQPGFELLLAAGGLAVAALLPGRKR
ncbi:MAG: hypothetical protein QXT68_04610 [Halobacteria archaeon]